MTYNIAITLIALVELGLIVLHFVLKSKDKRKKFDNAPSLADERFNYEVKISELEGKVALREHTINKIDEKIRRVADEKEPDNVDDLVSMFNELESEDNSY